MSAIVRSTLVGTRVFSSRNVSERQCRRSQLQQKYSTIVCQRSSISSQEASPDVSDSSRRSLLVAGASIALVATVFVDQPDAQAKRKPPPPPEPKKSEDDKNLSNVDAKKLASMRRKEAMKELLEDAKAKSKKAQEALKPPREVVRTVQEEVKPAVEEKIVEPVVEAVTADTSS